MHLMLNNIQRNTRRAKKLDEKTQMALTTRQQLCHLHLGNLDNSALKMQISFCTTCLDFLSLTDTAATAYLVAIRF